jgi:hypothetical protein
VITKVLHGLVQIPTLATSKDPRIWQAIVEPSFAQFADTEFFPTWTNAISAEGGRNLGNLWV